MRRHILNRTRRIIDWWHCKRGRHLWTMTFNVDNPAAWADIYCHSCGKELERQP